MYIVDIAADLNDEDDAGYVWTFLDEARDATKIVPGAIIIAGDEDAAAVCQVVDRGFPLRRATLNAAISTGPRRLSAAGFEASFDPPISLSVSSRRDRAFETRSRDLERKDL